MKTHLGLKFLLVSSTFLFLVTACANSGVTSSPTVDAISTRVAATMNAIGSEVTPLPTLAETQPPAPAITPTENSQPQSAPVSVAFVGPDRNAYYWDENMQESVKLNKQRRCR